jgi:hypothetical protein
LVVYAEKAFIFTAYSQQNFKMQVVKLSNCNIDYTVVLMLGFFWVAVCTSVMWC